MTVMGQRANQADQLAMETSGCANCWSCATGCRPAQAAEVIYDTADPLHAPCGAGPGAAGRRELGAPVMDEARRTGPGDPRVPAGQRSHAAGGP